MTRRQWRRVRHSSYSTPSPTTLLALLQVPHSQISRLPPPPRHPTPLSFIHQSGILPPSSQLLRRHPLLHAPPLAPPPPPPPPPPNSSSATSAGTSPPLATTSPSTLLSPLLQQNSICLCLLFFLALSWRTLNKLFFSLPIQSHLSQNFF